MADKLREGIDKIVQDTKPKKQYGDALTFLRGKGYDVDSWNDDEIENKVKNYFKEQMNYRDNLYNRVRKVPKEKWHEFANGYGVDWGKEYQEPITVKDFLEYFDYTSNDWNNLDDYLKKWGY